jgi:hypothetical protein
MKLAKALASEDGALGSILRGDFILNGALTGSSILLANQRPRNP